MRVSSPFIWDLWTLIELHSTIKLKVTFLFFTWFNFSHSHLQLYTCTINFVQLQNPYNSMFNFRLICWTHNFHTRTKCKSIWTHCTQHVYIYVVYCHLIMICEMSNDFAGKKKKFLLKLFTRNSAQLIKQTNQIMESRNQYCVQLSSCAPTLFYHIPIDRMAVWK